MLLVGADFEELKDGDDVEFLTVFSQKAQKDSAIYVRKLTYAIIIHYYN